MTWSTIPKPVEFNISKDLLGEGALRRAYKAHANDKEVINLTHGYEFQIWDLLETAPALPPTHHTLHYFLFMVQQASLIFSIVNSSSSNET